MSTKQTVYGQYTHAPLGDVSDLFLPPQPDLWGYMRTPFSPQLCRLAAELCVNTYTFNFDRFFEAGWMDATLQVENRLFSHVDAHQNARSTGEFLRSGLKYHRAKSMLEPSLADVFRGLRQVIATDTGKAAVMALPANDGHFVIAISFMGTGKKFYDWLTNFKMSCAGGIHEGFLNTARQFDNNSDEITFPRIAQLLGQERLSLRDILSECLKEDSRFRLLLCGHSQGGAVAQAYAYLLRSEHALHMPNVVGYTLAAPSILSKNFQENPAVYPFYHLQNTDDFVPAMGAHARLGVDMLYVPDDDFRLRHYGYAVHDEAALYARRCMRDIMRTMRDMPSVLELFIAFLRALSCMEDREGVKDILVTLNAQLKYLTPAMQALGLRGEDLLHLVESQLLGAYRGITDAPIDNAVVDALQARVGAYLCEFGPTVFSQCLLDVGFAPHRLTNEESDTPGAYIAIATRCIPALRPMLWVCGDAHALPCRTSPPGIWYAASPLLADTLSRFPAPEEEKTETFDKPME